MIARDVFEEELINDPDYIKHVKESRRIFYEVYQVKANPNKRTHPDHHNPSLKVRIIRINFHAVRVCEGICMPTTKELDNPLLDLRYKHFIPRAIGSQNKRKRHVHQEK